MNEVYLLAGILLIAFLYSSVGHGGASGYLALMALYGFAPSEMRTSALLLNILVSGIAFLSYYRTKKFELRKVLPFLAGSVPACFLGSLIDTDVRLYQILLGVALTAGVVRILLGIRERTYGIRAIPGTVALASGAAIGFFSGLIGIGGGIILSPLLILTRWASVKETACLSAFFILVNSLTGMGGLLLRDPVIGLPVLPFILAALLGGWAGSRLGSRHFTIPAMKFALAIVLLFAGVKLFIG